MDFTIAGQASNRRVIQFNLAPIAGSDSEAEAVMLENSLIRRSEHREFVQHSARFQELVSAGSTPSTLELDLIRQIEFVMLAMGPLLQEGPLVRPIYQ